MKEKTEKPQSVCKTRQVAEVLAEAGKQELKDPRAGARGETAVALPPQLPAWPLYDLSVLQNLSRGNPKLLERAKQLFVQTVPETVTDMQHKFAAADWLGVSAAAHKLKAAVDTMRIDTLKEVVRRIEINAKEQTDLQTVGMDLALLQAVLEEVIRQLQADTPL